MHTTIANHIPSGHESSEVQVLHTSVDLYAPYTNGRRSCTVIDNYALVYFSITQSGLALKIYSHIDCHWIVYIPITIYLVSSLPTESKGKK